MPEFHFNADGVVKSPIYCACPPQAGCSIFAETRHTTCIASFLKKYYAFLSRRGLAGVYEPFIKILLDKFHPEEAPVQAKGALTLHGITHPVTIDTQFNYISPVVAIEGKLKISQSSFNVKPYNWGVVKVGDALEIIFRIFFCEEHKSMPEYDLISQAEIKRLFEEYNIKVLIEKNYFGCEELKIK